MIGIKCIKENEDIVLLYSGVVTMYKDMVYQGKVSHSLQINEEGQIRNLITGTYYQQNTISPTGYIQVAISQGGVKKTYKVHKAVAETFIPNHNNLHDVNHKDGNKLHNHVSNLEWTSHKDNMTHARDNFLIQEPSINTVRNRKFSKAEIQYLRDIYIPNDKEFGCRPLSKKFNIHRSTLQKILNNTMYRFYE